MPTRIKRDSLGRAEIVGSGPLTTEVGLIFDEALDAGTYSAPRPTKYQTTVYRQRRKRISNTKFWDRETDFVEDTADEAKQKAEAYIASQKWKLIPGGPT